MTTATKPARIVLAQALCALSKELDPKTHSLIVGKLAAAFKQNYPTFDIDKFLSSAGIK